MKNKTSRRKSVVKALLFASGSAFAIQACAPIIAEFGAGKGPAPVALESAKICFADSGKGDAR